MSAVPLIGVPTRDDGAAVRIPNLAGAVLLDKLPEPSTPPSQSGMATVTELHPKTETDDTQPIPLRPREQKSAAPAAEPEPQPEPESTAKTQAPPQPAPVPPARPTPPEQVLVVPPKPQVGSTFQEFLSWSFSGIFWFSVLVGLVGQIMGFAAKFGGGTEGWAAAALVGGIFEFLMITGSSRGFHAICHDRRWHEFLPYLIGSACAAAVAAVMNFTHWSGDMALYFGGLTIAGYAFHTFSHLHPSLRDRKRLQEWKAAKARIEAEKEKRAEAERRAWEELQAEQERRQREIAAAAERAVASSARRSRSTPAASTKPQTKATKTSSKSPKYREEDLSGLVDTVLAAEQQAGERFGFRRIQPMFPGMTQAQARKLASLVAQRRDA